MFGRFNSELGEQELAFPSSLKSHSHKGAARGWKLIGALNFIRPLNYSAMAFRPARSAWAEGVIYVNS